MLSARQQFSTWHAEAKINTLLLIPLASSGLAQVASLLPCGLQELALLTQLWDFRDCLK